MAAARKLAATRRRSAALREEPERWSVYMIRRADGALYTGIALDVRRRFAQHVEGKGAKALRGRGPLELVLRRAAGSRGTALRLERAIKRLPKADKEGLVASRSRLAALAREARAPRL